MEIHIVFPKNSKLKLAMTYAVITRHHMRTTVSLDKSVVVLAKKVAVKERRSFSNLVEVALDSYVNTERTPEIRHAAAELRALGADPVMALRDKLAEVQRDQFLAQHSGT